MDDFSFYFSLGWHHIINAEALDHLMFITALAAIYLLSNWRQVLILVTAFTIGHSLTLALSTYDVIRIHAGLVEFLIPLTIAITAVFNLFQKNFSPKKLRLNYFLALFFGLIHGMGFANTIRFMLAKEQHIALPLFGFNVGLEAGQIVVVILILLMAYFAINKIGIPRRVWVYILSISSLCVALYMCVQRWPL